MKKILLIFALFYFTLLSAVGSVSGTVEDLGGSDLSNATVVLFQHQILIDSTQTAIDGTYSFSNVPAGYYDIRVSDPSHITEVRGINVVNSQNTQVNFSLSSTYATLSGVTYQPGSSITLPGVTISAIKDNIIYATTTSASGGVYSFSGLPSGVYSILFSHVNYATVIEAITIPQSGSVSLDQALESDFVNVGGIIYDPSGTTPIEGVTVQLLSGDVVIFSELSTALGAYNFTNLFNGYYTIRALGNSTYGAYAQGESMFEVGQSYTNDINLVANPGSISGTIYEVDEQTEIENARVTLWYYDNLIDSTLSAADGTYSFTNVSSGVYIVVAAKEDFSSTTSMIGVQLSPGENSPGQDVILGILPGTITGTVNQSIGTVSNATVRVYSYGNLPLATTISDEGGGYLIEGLSQDSYNVRFDAQGYQVKTLATNLSAGDTNTVNVTLSTSPGTIAGTITGSDAATPISGAIVEVIQNDIAVKSVYTNMNGEYSIWGFAAGSYTVNVNAPNNIYQTKVVGAAVTANNTTTVNVSLDEDPGSIGGTVTESDGTTPISGASVVVMKNNTQIDSAITGIDGTYYIDGLTPDNYTVTVSATDFETTSVGASVTANNTTTVNVSLDEDPGNIAGTITEMDGTTPIAGATVVASQNGVQKGSATTATDGTYSINGLSAGQYNVTVSATDFETTSVGAAVTANATTTVNVSLDEDPGNIAGTITEMDGTTPIAGATVVASQNGVQKGSATTATDGTYSINGLSAGQYNVTVSATDFETTSVGAAVTANATTTLNVSLDEDPGNIAGTITEIDGTTPIAGATVVASQNGIQKGSATTATDGTYSINGLSAGQYTVTVSATDFETTSVGAAVTANATTTVNVSLDEDPGSMGGVVTEIDGTTPIAGAVVAASQNGIQKGSAVTAANGTYVIDGLSPGSYSVVVSATNFQTQGLTGALVYPNAETQIDVSLAADPGAVAGIITKENGITPIAGALIQVFDGELLIAFTLSAADGSYRIDGLADTSFFVSVSSPDYDTQGASAAVEAGNVTILNFSLDLAVLPPLNLTKMVLKNKFFLQEDVIYKLSWDQSSSLEVVLYKIYRNGEFLANVNANQNPLEYLDPGRNPFVPVIYQVYTENSEGGISLPAEVIFK